MRTPEQQETAPILWCLLAAALFGASTPASKPLLGAVSPLQLSGLLYLGAAAAVAPWALSGWRGFAGIDAKSAIRLGLAVLFGGVLGPALLLSALSISAAGSVALWLNLETVWTALLARQFFKEHMDRATWAAVGLVVAASLLLSPASPGGGAAAGLVALACLAWGLDNNLTSVIDRFTPAQITFVKGAIAGALSLSLGLAFDPAPGGAAPIGFGLLIGALSYGLSLLLYVAGAQQLGATRSQLVFSTAPAWGLCLSWFLLGEPVLPAQLLAAALMAAAIWLWNRQRHGHSHQHERLLHQHRHRHDDGHHDHAHEPPVRGWHSHPHEHPPVRHSHPHRPDLHHRHEH